MKLRPDSRFGEIMLYEIDSFGYVVGYVSKNWHVMSEEDMLADRRLASRLYETKYQNWKRNNIDELLDVYERKERCHNRTFERFCRDIFNETS
ncbi:MAG: hypothetical protein ACREBI_02410 [Nitrosotalea sp.]